MVWYGAVDLPRDQSKPMAEGRGSLQFRAADRFYDGLPRFRGK
jgi:hypothetical protein